MWGVAGIAVLLLAGPGRAVEKAEPQKVKIIALAPGVYFRKARTEPIFTGCNQGWVIFRDYVLVIDANFPHQAETLITEIRKTTAKPIRFVFDTHYHGDHAFGNQIYTRDGAVAVASEKSLEEFLTKGRAGFKAAQDDPRTRQEYRGLSLKNPSLLFPRRVVFDDGDQRVELFHIGHAHTRGDAMAWLPKQRILFTGDACVNGAFNYLGDGDTASWIRVLTELEKLPVQRVAPGHGELADRSVLGRQKQYFIDLRAAVQKGIDAGAPLERIKATIDVPSFKDWTGLSVRTRGENIEHVYRELTHTLVSMGPHIHN